MVENEAKNCGIKYFKINFQRNQKPFFVKNRKNVAFARSKLQVLLSMYMVLILKLYVQCAYSIGNFFYQI